MRLPGCRGNLCVNAAKILDTVTSASSTWTAEVYEIRDLNSLRGIKEINSFSGHAVVLLTNKNSKEKYIIDLTFSQFIDPTTGLISFHNLFGENSINNPMLQRAIDERIANGEKVSVQTNIDYSKNQTAKQLFEKGYLPYSEFTNYLNLTVDPLSVSTSQPDLTYLEPDTLYSGNEQVDIINSINSYVLSRSSSPTSATDLSTAPVTAQPSLSSFLGILPAGAAQSFLATLAQSPLLALLPDSPTLTYNVMTWVRNLSSFAGHSLGVGLPTWLRQPTLRVCLRRQTRRHSQALLQWHNNYSAIVTAGYL